MLKRLGLGLIKGLVIGGAIGAAFHFGLGWTSATGLLAYLMAMGAGATAGILAGKPPWKQAAWIESVLKAVAGVGVGALAYWLGSRFGEFGLPLELPNVAAGTSWTEVPLVFVPAVSAVFGTLVELDNTDDDAAPERGKRSSVKARVDVGVEDAEVLLGDAEFEQQK
ncbi:MAG: hypothetical protein AAGE52_17455 [Myxococcota bacterium]